MAIKVGNYDVHSSGTIIGVAGEPIVFSFDNLTFEFRLIDDKENPKQEMTTEIPPDGTKLILNFKNFNNSLGTGNLSPLRVALLNSRPLFLNYRIYALADNAGKMIHYTWLLGEQEKGGNNAK